MHKTHFIHLFKYNDWATGQSADSIIKMRTKNEKAGEIISHLISAQEVWLNRVLKRNIITDPWKKWSEEEWAHKSITLTSEWINLLEGLNENDFEKRIEYKNTNGESFSNSIKDILTHVINHSTYHRAQIATLVRLAGDEPAKTDFILYQRQIQK